MKSIIAWAMLLAFAMGLGYADFGRLSKKCEADPWSDLNKSEAFPKQIRAVVWDETNV